MHSKINHDIFDFVLTYNKEICDNQKYFYFPLYFDIPNPTLGYLTPDLDYYQRNFICLFSTNKKTRDWGSNKRGLFRFFGFNKAMTGFKWPLWNRLKQFENSLYDYRKLLAANLPKYGIDFDIYGPNWEQKQFNGPIQPSVKGVCKDKSIMCKYKFVLATENCINKSGYISEKIFDVLLNASVPIYLGSSEIANEVPSNAMITLPHKISPKEVSEIIKSTSINQWNKLRHNGNNFLKSEKFNKRKPRYLAKKLLELLIKFHENKGN